MIDIDTKCRQCGKPITLRVRGEQARKLFEQEGAFCEACYRPSRRVGSATVSSAASNGHLAAARVFSLPKAPEST